MNPKPSDIRAFETALAQLRGTATHAAVQARQRVVHAAAPLLDDDAGLSALADGARDFEASGLFADGPWVDAAKLVPSLVKGGLLADEATAAIETLSELRVLAIAEGKIDHEALSAADAIEFLNAVVVHNLAFLADDTTEDARLRPVTYARAGRLIKLLLSRLSPATVLTALVDEIDALCAQRPILTHRTRELIARASLLVPARGLPDDVASRLDTYAHAITTPTLLSAKHPSVVDYQKAVAAATQDELRREAEAFAASMHATGLGNAHHAVLLRELGRARSELLAVALGLQPLGAAALQHHLDFTCEIIDTAIHPQTADAIYGLAGALERALFSRHAVAGGLRRLATLQLHPTVVKALQSGTGARGRLVSANAWLVAGALSVLGQPLGVGQGRNPTCQSARGISLWSVHAAGYLLNMLVNCARDASLEFDFEGTSLESHRLDGGVAAAIEGELDAVSLVLVPHLDRIYDEMMRRAAGRGVDPHRWVNPAFYGRWVPTGFACAIDVPTQSVTAYDEFVRLFFATHHPSFNDGDHLIYPNPVGAFVTDVHGRLLGAHAVSLRRVAVDPAGDLRAYFFNPNNEGRQDWGLGVVTSVTGHGEIPGESSLPFAQFASRLYAFHHHRNEGGPPAAVPDDVVSEVTRAARDSWGRAYPWHPSTPKGA